MNKKTDITKRLLLMAIMSWAIVVYAPAQELNAKININHSQIQGTDVSVFE